MSTPLNRALFTKKAPQSCDHFTVLRIYGASLIIRVYHINLSFIPFFGPLMLIYQNTAISLSTHTYLICYVV